MSASRVIAIIKAFRARHLSDIPTLQNQVETVILCRGAKNAVERNRIRRRVKAAVRDVMKKKDQKSAVVVIEAGRDFLSMNWDAVKNRVMKQMNHVA